LIQRDSIKMAEPPEKGQAAIQMLELRKVRAFAWPGETR